MTVQKIIPVTKPFMPPIEEFFPYLQEIWTSQILTNGGAKHKALEKELASYLAVEHISLFTNGTIALITALKALGIQGEVITTPFSFVATAHSLLWSNIKPVFVDIDPLTCNLNPAKIEAAITSKTTAILPVHCYGTPCDVDAIQLIADKHNLKVIYDAAHAFDVSYKGRSLLQSGDMSILSFHATKVFNTFEGGAIICKTEEEKKQIDQFKNFGFVDEVTVNECGINGKMNEIQAAFGLLQLRYVKQSINARKSIDLRYRLGFKGIPGIDMFAACYNASQNYSYFPILIKDNYPLSRDELYEKLKLRGILSRRYFYPLISDMPMYKDVSLNDGLFQARKISNEILCLPIYPDLSFEEQDLVISLIRD